MPEQNKTLAHRFSKYYLTIQKGGNAMFKRIFVLFALGMALMLSACSDQNPSAPDLTQNEPETGVAALAKGRSIPITATVDFATGTVVPGKEFVDDKGVLHVRGQINEAPITGDIQGTVRIVTNADVDLTNGSGRYRGKFVITGTFQGRTGTYSGKFRGKVIEGSFGPNDFAGRGRGGFEGSRIKGTAVPTPLGSGVFTLTGRIVKDDDRDDDKDDDKDDD